MEHKVRRQRKILGGALRQVGVLGAACLYAVKNNIKRLKEDHERASFLAKALNPYHSKKNGKDLQSFTNMVFLNRLKKRFRFIIFLKNRGIIISNLALKPD